MSRHPLLVAAALVLVSYGSPASAQPKGLELRGAPVVLEVDGRFSDQPRWMVNLINAPPTVVDDKPPALPVAAATLRVLNRHSRALFEAELERRGARLVGPPPAASPTSRVRVRIGPENGMGGHDSGLAAVVEVEAGGRAGAGRFVLPEDLAARRAGPALSRAFRDALDDALRDLGSPAKPVVSAPRRKLQVVVGLGGLDEAQRAHVSTSLLPCLAERVGGQDVEVRPSTTSGEKLLSMTVAERTDEPWQRRLDSVAATFDFAAGRHGKAPCSLWRSPLAAFDTRTRVVGQGVRLWWERAP